MPSSDWNIGANRSDSFGTKARIVTPSGNDLDPVAKSVVMLASGDITIVPMDGGTVLADAA